MANPLPWPKPDRTSVFAPYTLRVPDRAALQARLQAAGIPTAVDFLADLGTPCYKIASCANAPLPLTLKVAATGKPVIVLSGMATWPSLTQPSRLWMSRAPSAILATTIR